jgi:hypothetical protein
LIVILCNIADALGLSLVHTNKTLGRLRCLGMYTQANGTLTLTNPRPLEGVAQHFEQALARRPPDLMAGRCGPKEPVAPKARWCADVQPMHVRGVAVARPCEAKSREPARARRNVQQCNVQQFGRPHESEAR